MIRRETGDDHICVLTFDRPNSGANIFDAATLDELNEHLDAVEKDASLRGLIIASAKKSIFVAGADLKTLLQAAKTGEMREFIEPGQQVFNRLADLKIPTVAAIHGASRRRRLRSCARLRLSRRIGCSGNTDRFARNGPRTCFPPGAGARDCRA